jgi:hypothetical protein
VHLSTLAMGNKKVEAKNKSLKKVLGKYNKKKQSEKIEELKESGILSVQNQERMRQN